MIAKFFASFIFLFSVFIDASSISIALLNSELKKNYSFFERSLSESEMRIDTSSGKIFFTNQEILINVLSPFEENYRIYEDTIEIHDVFLDQTQVINIEELDNFFLNLLVDGVDEGEDSYSINVINDSLIQVIDDTRSNIISFSFLENQLNLIRYKDSLGVEHGIELTPL
tara:strand:+ start:16982 stop:17491 length:510 start_codon:yes stop_codon:yes gene_type:complete